MVYAIENIELRQKVDPNDFIYNKENQLPIYERDWTRLEAIKWCKSLHSFAGIDCTKQFRHVQAFGGICSALNSPRYQDTYSKQ